MSNLDQQFAETPRDRTLRPKANTLACQLYMRALKDAQHYASIVDSESSIPIEEAAVRGIIERLRRHGEIHGRSINVGMPTIPRMVASNGSPKFNK